MTIMDGKKTVDTRGKKGGGQQCFHFGACIDGSGGDIQKNICIDVDQGGIVAVKSQADCKNDRHTVDLSHCTVVPALHDCFVRLAVSSATNAALRTMQKSYSYEQTEQLIQQNIHYCHSHGVLGAIDFDDLRGFTGAYFHQNDDSRVSASSLILRSPSSSEDHSGFLDYTPRITQLLQGSIGDVRVALANGKRNIDEAIQSGCNAVVQGLEMTESLLKKMADKNMVWIPNLVNAKLMVEGGRGDEKSAFRRIMKDHMSLVNRARMMGVKVGMGTGSGCSGIIHGESAVDEIKLLQQCGFSLSEAIQCASSVGAELCGKRQCGMIKKGYKATFLVARGVASQLPRKLSYLENIYIAGSPSRDYRKNPVKTVFK